ncbi:MAG: helix-turn-helix domain-containing protein [Victivallaceae bacterium]
MYFSILDPVSPWKWGQKAELARRAGISRQYLSDILNCRKHAPPELAEKLEAASSEMKLNLKKEHFMYPKKAPESRFNTPDVRKRKGLALKKRLENDKLFMHELILMHTGLATGRGRRPSRRKMSKRDLRMVGMMAILAVKSISFQALSDLEGAIIQRDQLLEIARKMKMAGNSSPTTSVKFS